MWCGLWLWGTRVGQLSTEGAPDGVTPRRGRRARRATVARAVVFATHSHSSTDTHYS